MAREKCDIDGCDELIKPGSRLPTCAKCRASFGYWNKRSARQILYRRSRLKVYQNRLRSRFDDNGRKK